MHMYLRSFIYVHTKQVTVIRMQVCNHTAGLGTQRHAQTMYIENASVEMNISAAHRSPQ